MSTCRCHVEYSGRHMFSPDKMVLSIRPGTGTGQNCMCRVDHTFGDRGLGREERNVIYRVC